ncbi:MAG: sugar phosphate isomerase/epimerase family protein [Thermoguttaceae bacterium]|jgi:sugar phosphate isomerase/epimerase
MACQPRRAFLKHALAAGLGGTFAMGAMDTLRRASGAESRYQPKYAICNETFQDWPFDKAFACAAECGYTGIEIAPFTITNYVTDITVQRRSEIRRQAEKAGLEILGLHWLLAKTEGFYLTSPDAAVRKKTADYFCDLARLCAELGGKIMVLGSPKQRNLLPGVSRDAAMKYAAEVLHSTMPTMEKCGVVVAIEPLSTKETDFLTTAADGVELAKLVDSPYCKLHLDCKAMSSEPTPIPELIRQYRQWMVHFHANDPNLKGPGFGELEFVPIFQALQAIDYRGWVSVEVFDYTPGSERLARDSIHYMKECVAKLGG